jgi:hypothetical protein
MQKANRKTRGTQETWSTFISFRLSRWFTVNVFLSLGPCTMWIWTVLPTFWEYTMLPSSPFPQGSIETRNYIFSDTHTPYSLQPWRRRQYVPPKRRYYCTFSQSKDPRINTQNTRISKIGKDIWILYVTKNQSRFPKFTYATCVKELIEIWLTEDRCRCKQTDRLVVHMRTN